MTNLILISIVVSTIITSIVSFAKPAYKKFAWKFAISINIALSFALWILAAFSLKSFVEIETTAWLLILWGLALGTGSNIFYDVWSLVKGLSDKIRSSINK